jgi:hypothetical protein
MSDSSSHSILDVTLDELPEDWRNTINTATKQFQDKCLLSYAKDHEGKVYQKNYLPRVLLDGQTDPNDVAARNAMYETISRAISTTLANHNEVFLRSLTNAMKEALNQNTGPRGPVYSNQNTGRNEATATNVLPGNGGHILGGSFAQQGGGNGQHSVQRPMVDYSDSQSAAKFASGGKRIVRDFNAPPYQGRVAPEEIPPGYHYVTEGYTFNAYENPGYQSAGQETPSAL